MPDERCRVLRRRLARREQLVRSRSRATNEIHAVGQRRLQGKPPCSDLFGVKRRQWLAGLKLPVKAREPVDAGVGHVEFLDCEINAVERLIGRWRFVGERVERHARAAAGLRDAFLGSREGARDAVEDVLEARSASRARSAAMGVADGCGAAAIAWPRGAPTRLGTPRRECTSGSGCAERRRGADRLSRA
jgi:transposase